MEPNKFWKKYKEAYLKRDEIIEPIIKRIEEAFKIEDKELRKTLLTSLLRSYFDDLIEAME